MTARKDPASEPGRTATRTKPVRVTVDLDPATYTELNRWVGGAAIAVNPDFPRLPLAKYYSRDFTVSFRLCLTSSRPGLVCGYAK